MGLQTVTGPYRTGIIFLPGDVRLLGDALKLSETLCGPHERREAGAGPGADACLYASCAHEAGDFVPSWDRRPDHVRRTRLLMNPCGLSHEEAALKNTGLPFQEKDGMARKTFAQMAAAK